MGVGRDCVYDDSSSQLGYNTSGSGMLNIPTNTAPKRPQTIDKQQRCATILREESSLNDPRKRTVLGQKKNSKKNISDWVFSHVTAHCAVLFSSLNEIQSEKLK